MMNRITRLAAVPRAIETLAAGRTSGQSLQQVAQYSNRCHVFDNSSSFRRYGLLDQLGFGNSNRPVVHGGVPKMFFSAAAEAVQHAEFPRPYSNFKPKEVVLYQYEACPFCNKVKALLDYYEIPYKVVEVNPMNKKEIEWSDYKKVPILVVDGEQMVDSTDIISKLSERIHAGDVDSGISHSEEMKWRGWVDSNLVHVLSPNIYRTVGEAIESFDYITTHGNFSFMERIVAKYGGAAAMYIVSKKLKKRHNITDARAALYEAADTWVDALEGRRFLGGSIPNLADLSVFGVLRPIRHLQAGKDMVEKTRIGEWYNRMETAVGASSRIQA